MTPLVRGANFAHTLGIIERKERQKRSLRQEILRAALDVFANEGYQHLSIRKLAEKIEYSPTAIYLHFKDKAELFECVCEQTFVQLSAIFEAIVGRSRTPLDALRASCRAYVDFGLKHPDQYTVAFLLDSGQRLAPAEVLSKFPTAMTAFEQLRAGVTACMLAGNFAEADPEIVSQIIWAGLHGITALLIIKPSFPWPDRGRLIDLVIETMLQGLTLTNLPALETGAALRDRDQGYETSGSTPAMFPASRRPVLVAGRDMAMAPVSETPVLERRLARVLEAIADDPCLNVNELANMVNLTPSRLQHLFKQHLKVCIRDFSVKQRLQKAARLLSSTDMRVKEVTFEVGYAHCSSFIRAFQKQFGQSPESYRNHRPESAKAQCAN